MCVQTKPHACRRLLWDISKSRTLCKSACLTYQNFPEAPSPARSSCLCSLWIDQISSAALHLLFLVSQTDDFSMCVRTVFEGILLNWSLQSTSDICVIFKSVSVWY